MRITSSMYYKNLYERSNGQLNNALFDVNRQIASEVKIEYAHEDLRIFSETMRLDNEVEVLNQIGASTKSALKFSDQSDSVLGEFETATNRMRTVLLKASNGTNDQTSLDALAKELRGIEKNLMTLANTSINGQFLFSGSLTDTPPIDANGKYQGNDKSLEAFMGSNVRQSYNVTGAELFLGEKKTVSRVVTTNVPLSNLSASYPDFTATTPSGSGGMIKVGDTIRDLMGDNDNIIDTVTPKHFFYVSGTNSSGEAFNSKIALRDNDKVGDLLKQIGDLYGNTIDTKVVDVSLNDSGEIVIKDKLKGSSKIDFHMIGATDLAGGADANVTNIDDLGEGESNFDKIKASTSTATKPNLYVKEFVKSNLTPADSVAATNILGSTLYDRVAFEVKGSKVSANASQIVKNTNAFATADTRLLDVASGSTLNGKSFTYEGVDVNGAAFNVTINLANTGSTFTIGATTYDIFNMQTPRVAVDADKMTYRQLMDVINMVATASLPATNSATDYDSAIFSANTRAKTALSYDGKIEFEEIGTGNTSARISIYDSNSGDFTQPPSVLRFNTNNTITIRDAKTDFFKDIDEIISAVENYSLYPNASSANPRALGIENALSRLDVLQDHIYRMHSVAGVQTNVLDTASQRTKLLEISTKSLRSQVLDTDLAEAKLQLVQLQTTYEAMLSTVGKVSKLSLVNYL